MDLSPTVLMETLRSDLRLACGTDVVDRALVDASFTKLAQPADVAVTLLLRSLTKKFQSQTDVADARALDLFLQWNQRCSEWVPPDPDVEVERVMLGEFRSVFASCFELPDGGLLDFSDLAPAEFRCGPGASVGVNVTDYYSKVAAQDMTTTSDDLYWHYYNSTLPFELHRLTEETRSTHFKTTTVRGSIIGFAAKNSEISRTRCTEPSLNMMYQLGTGAVIEGVLRQRFSIDLATQPKCNNELSRIGSLDGTFGTTDMSSASDATSVKFWSWAMPYKSIHDWFMWIRSPEAKYRRTAKAKTWTWVKLEMLSSMGNGFTFPLMTLIYTCAVAAVYRTLGIRLIRNKILPDGSTKPGNFGVFGDDIIVVAEAFSSVNRLLGLLGYHVNADKSFGSGPFRESCGTDWFLGSNVRGVYCKRLDTPQHRYTLINRLNAWSSNWDIPLPQTIKLLLKTVFWLPVPPWESSDSGVIVPFELFSVKEHDEYGGFVYRAMRPVVLKWEPAEGLTAKHFNKKHQLADTAYPRYINVDGYVLAAVQGYIRGGFVAVRGDPDTDKYRKTRQTTPGWGYNGESTVGFTRSGWATFGRAMATLNTGKPVSEPPSA